jgi:hypothetical protein
METNAWNILTTRILPSLPLLAVWIWGLFASRRLPPAPSVWRRNVPTALVVLLALWFVTPALYASAVSASATDGGAAVRMVLQVSLGLIQAGCWFVVLRAIVEPNATGSAS